VITVMARDGDNGTRSPTTGLGKRSPLLALALAVLLLAQPECRSPPVLGQILGGRRLGRRPFLRAGRHRHGIGAVAAFFYLRWW